MPKIPVNTANNALTRCGFLLKKGDARLVAETATGPSDKELVAKARDLGIEHRNSKPRPRTQEEEALYRRSVEWIAARAAGKLEEPGVIDSLVSRLIDEAVDGKRDAEMFSCEYCQRVPHDLSKWKTLGDFMGEPSDQTKFVVGLGCHAGTIGEEWFDEFEGLVYDALQVSSKEAKSIAPPEIAAMVASIGSGKFKNMAIEDAYESLCDLGQSEYGLMEQVGAAVFRDALMAHRPDAKSRLESDIAVSERRQRTTEKAASAIKAQFGVRRIEKKDVFEVANVIAHHVRDPEGVDLAMRLYQHKQIRSLFANSKARSAFQNLCGEWLGDIGFRDADFSSPLAKLFVALDDAWRNDGRSWLVTVSQGSHAHTTPHTFGRDNWVFFLSYALGGRKRWIGRRIGVVIRRFEALSDTTTGLPLKSVGGVYIGEDGIHLCSAAEIKSACTTCAETGQPIEPEPAVRYVAMSDLCPAFAKAVAGETSE